MKKVLPAIISAAMIFGCAAANAQNSELIDMGGGVTREVKTDIDGRIRQTNYLINPAVKDGVLTIPYVEDFEDIEVRFTDENDDALKIKQVFIEEGCKTVTGSLGYGADIHIPASISKFSYSEANKIFADENNPNYCDIDGVLFSKDKTVLEVYGGYRKDESYTVPDGVVEIVRMGSPALKEISLPKSLKKVNLRYELERTDWYKNGNMHVIGDGILVGPCKDEVLVTPPEARSIADLAFRNSNFKSVHIGDFVKSIGECAFDGCVITDELTIGTGVEKIGRYAFRNLNKNDKISMLTEDRPWIKTLILPEGLKTIGEYAFEGAKIEEIYFPESITEINDFMRGCFAKPFVKRGSELQMLLSDCGYLCFDKQTKEAILPEYNGDYVNNRKGAYQIGIWKSDENGRIYCDSEHQWLFNGDKKPFVIMNDLYVPLRLTCERFGIPIYWNENLFIAEVGERGEIEPFSGESTAKFGIEGLVRYNGRVLPSRPAISMLVDIMSGKEYFNEKGSHSAVNIGGTLYVPLLDLAESGLLPGYTMQPTFTPCAVAITE